AAVHPRRAALLRQRCDRAGSVSAWVRKPQSRPSRLRKLDGAAEARLIALACSPPPAGRDHWTMQLLADQLVALDVVEAVSDETVRRMLKKTRSSRGSRNSGASRQRRTRRL